MSLTAQTIIERGMKMHAEVDTNVRTIILEQLSDFLDGLYAVFDLDQSVKSTDITTTANSETVTMPTDLLRVDSIVWAEPYYGSMPRVLSPKEYNIAQSSYSNTTGNPPFAVFFDYQGRVLRFQPIPSGALTAKLMYYPQHSDIALATDLQYFPMTRLLVLFAYLSYVDYDRAIPAPRHQLEYETLLSQFTFRYRSKIDPPELDGAYYKTVDVAIP